MKLDYFYAGQTERLIKHLIRMFSGFEVQDGFDDDGNKTYRRVPCRYGDISRNTAVSMYENSENTMPSAPFMSITISNMSLSRENVRSPSVERTVVPINKKVDGQYINDVENYYEVERHNPVPWDIEFVVDIWTTNTQNKLELFEQISTLFAPTCPLQLSVNPMDWTSFNYVELTGYNHSSRGFPQGQDHNIDISQFQFKTMIWYSLPAKVDRATLIHKIVSNINETREDDYVIPNLSDSKRLAQDVYTPGNHMIQLEETDDPNVYNVELLTKHGNNIVDGSKLSWRELMKYYSGTATTCSMQILEGVEMGALGDATIELTATSNIVTATFKEGHTIPHAYDISSFIDPSTVKKDKAADSIFMIHDSITVLDLTILQNIKVYDVNTKEVVELDKVSVQDYQYKVAVVIEGKEYEFDYSYPIQYKIVDSEFSHFEFLPMQKYAFNEKDDKYYKYTKELGWHLFDFTYSPGEWRLGFDAD